MRLLRRSYWPVMSAVYWCIAFGLIWHASPISVDGGGPLATFYWSEDDPTPSLSQYANDWHVRFQFLYPYWVGAAIVTVLGCGTAWVFVRRP
jgi:hypothetical protein